MEADEESRGGERRGGAGTVVVLGGTGWVGRHVSAAFAAEGYDVVTVARSAARGPAPARFVALDLVTAPVEEIVAMLEAARPDVVVNAAGQPWGTSEPVMRTSLLVLTERVVAALGRLSFRPRFVQIGTVMEYGPTSPGLPIGEDTEPRPAGPYGEIKLAGSRAVLAAARAGTVDGVVVRLVNVVGPGTAAASLLGRVLDRLLTARREGSAAELVLAPLRAERDYIDIRDAADAVVAAARADVTGRAVNIGSGTTVPVRRLVQQLIATSGVETRLEERDPAAGGPVSPGAGGDWLAVDPGPARLRLGWKARRDLRDALRDDWTERAAR
ncbi:NAD-dependent epimerase/dehydratase family protein [Streptomyces roseoverticillatus]|uniref:NAD(P)-dependent oxidoreductase n=1 Tax=Streptomyces roseoverticillatus TaxID=66429 RepID=A0ABV3J3X5_9ACTN